MRRLERNLRFVNNAAARHIRLVSGVSRDELTRQRYRHLDIRDGNGVLQHRAGQKRKLVKKAGVKLD